MNCVGVGGAPEEFRSVFDRNGIGCGQTRGENVGDDDLSYSSV